MRMKETMLILAAAVVLLGTAVPIAAVQAPDDSTGIVLSVTGSVTVSRRDTTFTAYEGCEVMYGDTIRIDYGGRCGGITPRGNTFEKSGICLLIIAKKKDRANDIGIWMLRQIKDFIGEPRRIALHTRSATEREWDLRRNPIDLLFPADKGSVRPDNAGFYWITTDDGGGCELIITSGSGEERAHAVSGNTAIISDLEPGASYEWRVRMRRNGNVLTSARSSFVALTGQEERRLEHAFAELDHLEAAVLLLSLGLCHEAINRFDAAIAAHPEEESALFWRARAFARAKLYENAFEDLSRISAAR
jgi:hypothetical protein